MRTVSSFSYISVLEQHPYRQPTVLPEMRTTALLLFIGAVVALESVSALQLGRVISSLTGAKEAAVDSEEKQSGPVLPLPALPSLPPLPPLQKLETIFATKTLFVQVTKRVTQHPVCMTVYGVKPPCLPSHHYHHDEDDHEYREDGGSWEENEGLYIQPSAAVRIHATAAPGFEHSYYERDGRSEALEASQETPDVERKGRYLEIRTPTPAASSMPIEANLEEGSGSNTEARVFENLLPKSTITKLLTKTLWVTKVEKVIDHRVTATVEVKNCVPTDSKIPFCDKEHHPNHHYHEDHHDSPKPVHHEEYDHKPVQHEEYDHKPVHHEEYDHKPVHHVEYDHKPVHHDLYEHHHDDEHHYKEGEATLHKQPAGYGKKPDHHKKPTTTTTTTTTQKPVHNYKPVHEYEEQHEHQPEYAHKPENQQQYAHKPENQQQYAHKPEHQPEYAHKPEHQPGYAHKPEHQPEYTHKPEHQPEYTHKPEHQPEHAHKPEHGSQKPVQVHWRGNEQEE